MPGARCLGTLLLHLPQVLWRQDRDTPNSVCFRRGDDTFENCIPLCFDCHAEVEHYNEQHPRGRKFCESELRKHRDTWFSKVEEMNTLTPLPSDAPQVIQAVQEMATWLPGAI